MKTVLIECRHIGHEFQRARKSACIPMRDAAKMLGLDRKTLAKYEGGKLPIPDNMVHRLAHYGYIYINARKTYDRYA